MAWYDASCNVSDIDVFTWPSGAIASIVYGKHDWPSMSYRLIFALGDWGERAPSERLFRDATALMNRQKAAAKQIMPELFE
jgi:hypothetical protein